MSLYIGEKIRSLRLAKKFTQKQLAEKIHVDESTISQYENNMRLPSYEVLIKICYLFEISSDYFLGIDSESCLHIPIGSLSEEQVQSVLTIITEYQKLNNQL